MTLLALTTLALPAAYDGSTHALADRSDGANTSRPGDHLGGRGRSTSALAVGAAETRQLTSTPPRVRIGQPAFYSARCADAYQAVRWYRARYDTHRQVMGQSLAPRVETGMACPRLRERAGYWVRAARVNREAARLYTRTIHNRSTWLAAVDEVQRAFPGTEGWLLSCSAAESRWGAWVRYGGSPYYDGYEYTNQVGGFLQYRWRTFQGHYRHGLDSLRSRGFRVSLPSPDDVRAWLMPVGQAVAGGWARWSGNDDSHWSASHGRGC